MQCVCVDLQFGDKTQRKFQLTGFDGSLNARDGEHLTLCPTAAKPDDVITKWHQQRDHLKQ